MSIALYMNIDKRQRIPNRQSNMDKPRETGNIGYTRRRQAKQNALDTAVRKETQIT